MTSLKNLLVRRGDGGSGRYHVILFDDTFFCFEI